MKERRTRHKTAGSSLCLGIAVMIACTITGCTDRASIHMISLADRRISTTEPLIERITPRECYFWENDKGELCVAMRSSSGSILGRRFKKEAIASFLLEGPPAGAARNYTVTRRTARILRHAGMSHTRCASLGGIIAVWDYGGNTLRGRLRFSAKRQDYSVLVGWSGNTKVLFVGEFTAVRNRTAGEKILTRTEEGGMKRSPPRPQPIPVQGPPRKPPEN